MHLFLTIGTPAGIVQTNYCNFRKINVTQEELLTIFNEIRAILKKYEKKPIEATFDIQGRYELWSKKEFELMGKKRKEIYFSGLIIQSNYVGFYFMPVYANKELKEVFQPDLLKTLKGKSCFHIKTNDKELLKQIKDAAKAGYELYRQRGWV